MSIQQITERETALTNTLRQMTEALTLVTKERDEYQLEASMWAAELKSLRDSGVELPDPVGRTWIGSAINGNYSWTYAESPLRDYGDRRAMAERERAAKVCEDLEEPAWYGYECPNTFTDAKIMCAEAIRKGEKS